MTAPAAFALTHDASPDRHRRAAELLGGTGEPLPDVLRGLMRDVGLPSGLAELGYGAADVDDLVAGALQQQRLLATAPVPVTPDDLAAVFAGSLEHW
jgi:hydroxyacid-oxoacid transhydrogenase